MHGNASFTEVDVRAEPRPARPRARSPDGDHRPLLGDARARHAQLRPFGLEPLLEPVQHGGRAAGRRRDEVAILGQPHRDAVVEHHPVEPQHEPVADRPDGEVRHPVRVHPVQERGGVRPDDLDLAERRGVEHTDGGAHREALARDGAVQSSSGSGKYRGRFHCPTFSNTAPRSTWAACIGVRRLGSSSAGPRSRPASTRERHRHERRPRVRRALRAQLPAERGVHDLGGQHAARASLVDRGADVGRALHVLDAAQAAVHRLQDVLRRSGRAAGRRSASRGRRLACTSTATLGGRPSPAAAPTTSSQSAAPCHRARRSRAPRRSADRRRSRGRAAPPGSSRPRRRRGRRRPCAARRRGPSGGRPRRARRRRSRRRPSLPGRRQRGRPRRRRRSASRRPRASSRSSRR